MKDFGFKLGELLHAFAGTKRPKLAALILAGGSGTRLGSDTPKQHLEILGKSVVCRTLLAFEECPYVDEIIVAARQDDIPIYKELIQKHSITKVKTVTAGGISACQPRCKIRRNSRCGKMPCHSRADNAGGS